MLPKEVALFSESLKLCQNEIEGNIDIRGKTELIPVGADINCFVICLIHYETNLYFITKS